MSDYNEVHRRSEDSDEEFWLNKIYSKMVSMPNSQLKKIDGTKSDVELKKIEEKNTDVEIKKIKSKKSNSEPKKSNIKKSIDKASESNTESPNHDNWLGYIIAAFINETITQSIECCPGCKDLKNSPLFHTHHQSGLLEKLFMFSPSVRAMLISKLPVLVADYVTKYPDF